MEHQRASGESMGANAPESKPDVGSGGSDGSQPAPAASGDVDLTTTGIQGLDAQLGGGIPRGTTLLLLGEPTNAISVFSEQFAGGGVNSGDAVHFFQFDRPAGGVRDAVLAYHGGNGATDTSVSVYDGYGGQFGQPHGDANPVPRDDAYGYALKALQSAGPDRPFRLVMESLSSLVSTETEGEALEFLRNVTHLTREVGGTTVVTIVKGLHSQSFERRAQHLVSGVFELGVEKKGFGLYSYLMVRKLVGVPDPVRLLLFKETEKGLWLESTKRVF